VRKRPSGYKKNKTDISIDYLRYRYNYFYKRGKYAEAKKVSDRADALFGRNIDNEFHMKLSEKENINDPFGIGKTNKIKYGGRKKGL
jgi:hypothetical protein